jgi:hypothetical protein
MNCPLRFRGLKLFGGRPLFDFWNPNATPHAKPSQHHHQTPVPAHHPDAMLMHELPVEVQRIKAVWRQANQNFLFHNVPQGTIILSI